MSKLPVFRLPVTSKPSAPATTPTFESCLGTFTVNIPARHESPVNHPIVAAAPQAKTIDPTTSERYGSITRDRQKRRPTHEWSSLEEFHAWRLDQERDHGIKLLLSPHTTRRSDGPLWRDIRTYTCSRQGTGGKNKYFRKRGDMIGRTRLSERTGCGCRVVIKTYHHVSTVLGWYRTEHNHATRVANLMITRLRDSTRAYVLNLLRRDMSPKEILMRVRRAHSEHERGHYITMHEIYRMRKIAKREEAARSISSDQLSYEHSEGSLTKEDEDEETTVQETEDTSVTDPTQADEDLEDSDEQSDGCTDSGTRTSPPSDSAIHDVYTAGAAASMEYAALPAVPATQWVHNFAPPPVPPPHSMPMPCYMPPPLVVYLPYPPYQMTLYPVYPVYFPPPTY